MPVTVTCDSVEVKPSTGSSVKLEIDNGDFNTEEVYDEIDLEKYAEYKGVEIVEE